MYFEHYYYDEEEKGFSKTQQWLDFIDFANVAKVVLKDAAKRYTEKNVEKIRKKDSCWWYELKRLWNQFDPIGVLGEGSDCPDDEYESYIAPTFALLEKGADFTELNNYIGFIVREYMGMSLSDNYIA